MCTQRILKRGMFFSMMIVLVLVLWNLAIRSALLPLDEHSTQALRGGQTFYCESQIQVTWCTVCSPRDDGNYEKCQPASNSTDCNTYVGSYCMACIITGYPTCPGPKNVYQFPGCSPPIWDVETCDKIYQTTTSTAYSGGSCPNNCPP